MSLIAVTVATNLGSASASPSVISPAIVHNDESNIENHNGYIQTSFYVVGVFGTTTLATLNIQASFNSTDIPDSDSFWFDIGSAFTAVGVQTININAAKFRAVTTSGDTGTQLTVMGM